MLWIKLVVVQGSLLVCLASLKYRTTQVCLGASTATLGLEPVGVSVLQSPSWLLTSSWQVSGASSLQAGDTEAQHSTAAHVDIILRGKHQL